MKMDLSLNNLQCHKTKSNQICETHATTHSLIQLFALMHRFEQVFPAY